MLLGLMGCGQVTTNEVNPETSPPPVVDPESSPNTAQKKVVTTFTVIADMAKAVAGDQLQVESLTRIGAEIHGYEPTPSDLVRAQGADLLLYNGMNLERWFEPFLKNVGSMPTVLLTEGIDPIPVASGAYANKPNPHAWMSPRNALIYVENIRRAFVELDPENAETYNTNAAAYSEQLRAIDQQLTTALQQVPKNQRFLVSCEGAFSYLARDYGLQEIYLWPINAEQQYTPKQIQAAITAVETNNVPTVFCETTVNDDAQRQVAKATGARFGGNLYVDSLSEPDGDVPTYLKLLEYDVNTISQGLLNNANAPP